MSRNASSNTRAPRLAEPVERVQTATAVAPSRALRRRAAAAASTGSLATSAPAPRAEPAGAWTSIEGAAAFLGVRPVTLRRAIERHARRAEDGQVVASVDGIVARKLGRTWRVWLGPGWRSPASTT